MLTMGNYINMLIISILYTIFAATYTYKFWIKEEWPKLLLVVVTLPIYWFLTWIIL